MISSHCRTLRAESEKGNNSCCSSCAPSLFALNFDFYMKTSSLISDTHGEDQRPERTNLQLLQPNGRAALPLPGCSINCCKAKNLIGNPTWDFLLKQGGNEVLKSIYQPGNAFYIPFLPLLQWANPDKGLKADTAPRRR